MTNCDPRIEAYMEAVETGKVEASKDVKALMKHVRKCFETEDIYVDQQQLTDYLGLARYFPYDEVFPWQQFVIGLHDCTYWRENGRPRWPDLFCLIGRGAGKDGTIALESTALASEYNGIREYDVDICANNEDQALRPVQDIVGAFEQPKWLKKLQRFFKWTREKVVCKSTRSTIKGHTNNPGGKDGLRSGMVVLNEIHQYQDYKNINVFTTGLGKKKHPRRSYYTTQGDVREGPLDDLLDQVSPDYKAQIDPAALEGCRVNGKIMTIPCLWKQYTPNGIEYREDLREKYDLPVPDSIENLEAYFLRVLVMCFQDIFLFFPLFSTHLADTASQRHDMNDTAFNFHTK